MTTNERPITIETSCGQIFRLYPSEMTDRQLKGLLEQNAEDNCNPMHMAALRDELQFGSKDKKSGTNILLVGEKNE